MFANGNQLGEMLMKTEGKCPKCHEIMTFEDGIDLAKQAGIKENVVMCNHCHAIYTIELSPRGITFVADVTKNYPLDKYPQIRWALHTRDYRAAMQMSIGFGVILTLVGVTAIGTERWIDTLIWLPIGILLLVGAYLIKKFRLSRKDAN